VYGIVVDRCHSLAVEIMSRELALDEIVTEFLLNTCRLCERSADAHAVQAAIWCGVFASSLRDELDTERIPLTTGSVAEFYIKPALPHIGDIDVMHHLNSQLAIPRGHPPAEFHNYVKVGEITDNHLGLPGYVYLQLRYILTECSDDDNYVRLYNAVEIERGQYFQIKHATLSGRTTDQHYFLTTNQHFYQLTQ